jgi:hypothetical protein
MTIEAERYADLALFAGVRELLSLPRFAADARMCRADHRRTEPPTGRAPLPCHPSSSAPTEGGAGHRAVPLGDVPPGGRDASPGGLRPLVLRPFPLTRQFPAYYEHSPRGRCVLHTGGGALAYLGIPIQAAETHPL